MDFRFFLWYIVHYVYFAFKFSHSYNFFSLFPAYSHLALMSVFASISHWCVIKIVRRSSRLTGQVCSVIFYRLLLEIWKRAINSYWPGVTSVSLFEYTHSVTDGCITLLPGSVLLKNRYDSHWPDLKW